MKLDELKNLEEIIYRHLSGLEINSLLADTGISEQDIVNLIHEYDTRTSNLSYCGGSSDWDGGGNPHRIMEEEYARRKEPENSFVEYCERKGYSPWYCRDAIINACDKVEFDAHKKAAEQEIEANKEAAEQGDANAQYELGITYNYHLHEYGEEYRREEEKWFRRAAEQGHSKAQFEIGDFYRNKDDAEAAKWYRKAAEQGHRDAQRRLGHLYRFGDGVNQDYAEAAKWFRKAAEQGDSNAQHYLGVLYSNGLGVNRDYEEAIKWYEKAAEQGDYEARRGLEYARSALALDALRASICKEKETDKKCEQKETGKKREGFFWRIFCCFFKK